MFQESKVFINFATKDLARARAFYTEIGCTSNEHVRDANAISVVLNEHIYLMILVEDFFKTFIKTEIADAKTTTEALVALSLPSKEAVDELFAKVLAAGGSEVREARDLGFMYSHDFTDPDGHIFEPFWMDPKAASGEMAVN